MKQSGYGSRHSCPYACPYYEGKQVGYTQISLPNVEKVAGRLIGLPNHPGLTKNELDYVVHVVKGLFQGEG